MQIPPAYTISDEMLHTLSQIDSLRIFITSYEIAPHLRERIQRNSVLKSSLFSARIEGNPLHIDDLYATDEKEKKLEIMNILKAITYIEKKVATRKPLTIATIKQLHATVVKDLRTDGGAFRHEMNAIFNTAGIAVYVPPPPGSIGGLLDQMLVYANAQQEKFPLIKGFITHLVYQKIHPFIDGNGRVGRLLIAAVLKANDYDFGVAIPFEEYLDNHRDEYYYYLDIGMQDTNSYLLFMIQAFLEQCKVTQQAILKETQKKETLNIPPRQEEIYTIIKEHNIVSFDFIRRRFLKVPERTLRYDLKKLQDGGYIVKIGKTRGSYYKIMNK